ncbi:MAG: T9SS type A sorting domain-containing protein [Bacteroidota bacterium]|nr:T9SS type A sorting domain-containing protein [Bacteroidota bacterium]
MKNRILPFSLFVFAFGLIFFLFSSSFLHQKEISPVSNAPILNNGKVFKPAAKYLAKIRNNQLTGQIDFRDVVNARSHVEALASANRSEVMDWKLLGPDNVSGRTRAIIYDQTDASSSTIISASVSGGLYKSSNNGLTWNKINGWAKALKVCCLTQDDQGNVYAGTGESFATEDFTDFGPLGYNGGFIGTGIYKSTDQDNFTQLPNTKPTINNDTAAWAFTNELAYDAGKNNLFASTNRGLRYSNDRGVTWALARTLEGSLLVGNSLDVKVGSDGKVVTDIDNLCYISSTGDPHLFILMSRGDSASLPTSNIGRIEFAIAPSDPNIIYASVVKESGAMDNIYVSEDGGTDWRIIAPGGTATLNIFGHGVEVGSGQGIYDNCIIVFPDDPYHVLLGGINLWEGKKYNGLGYYQWTERSLDIPIPGFTSHLHEDQHIIVFRPGFNNQCAVGNDGGVSTGLLNSDYYEFSEANKVYYSSQFYTVDYSGYKYYAIGGLQDNGVLTISGYGNPATIKNGRTLTGGDGGYSNISSINPNVLIVSTHNIGATNLRRSDDDGVSYSNSFLGGGMSIPDNTFLLPSILWEDFDNENSRDSVYFFTRQYSYSQNDNVAVFSHNQEFPFYYVLPRDMGPNDSILVQDVVATKFFITYTDEVWMTQEAIDFTKLPPEWFLISDRTNVGFEGNPQCIAASADANYVFIGTQEGKLYRIANITLAYNYERADVRSPYCQISTTEIALNVPGTSTPISQAVTSIAIDPNDARHVIVTLGNYGNDHYVLKSSDALAEAPEFTSAQGNLPKMPVYSSLIEMNNTNMAIIGTEHGLFTCANVWGSNPEWSQPVDENEEATGEMPIFMLKQQLIAQPSVPVWTFDGTDSTLVWYHGTDNYGVVYAGTYGRGIFLNDQFQKPVGIADPIPGKSSASSMNVYPNPVRDQVFVDFNLEEPAHVQIHVYDINGKAIHQKDLSLQPKGLLHYEMNCSSLPGGTYILQLFAGQTRESIKFVVYK